MKQVLILCTGNSCRSIMAEALINHHLKGRWQAFSAGVDPSVVNPLAIKVLHELGIDASAYRSKSVAEFIERDDLDLVITVCDNARESCPVFPKPVRQVHLGIEDPAPHSSEPEEQALAAFRAARDKVKQLIIPYLANL